MKKENEMNTSFHTGKSNALKGVVDNKGAELQQRRDELHMMTDRVFELSTRPLRRLLMSRGQKELAKTVLEGYRRGLQIEIETQDSIWKLLGEAMTINTKKSLEACLQMSDSTRKRVADAHINKEILSHTNNIQTLTQDFLNEIDTMREHLDDAHEDDKPLIQSMINRLRDNWFARIEMLSDRISEVILVNLKSVEL